MEHLIWNFIPELNLKLRKFHLENSNHISHDNPVPLLDFLKDLVVAPVLLTAKHLQEGRLEVHKPLKHKERGIPPGWHILPDIRA